MKTFVRTLRLHRELLLNYFRARKQFSSGVIEGFNNKAKGRYEKIVRLPNLPDLGTRAISQTWQPSEPQLPHRFF